MVSKAIYNIFNFDYLKTNLSTTLKPPVWPQTEKQSEEIIGSQNKK